MKQEAGLCVRDGDDAAHLQGAIVFDKKAHIEHEEIYAVGIDAADISFFNGHRSVKIIRNLAIQHLSVAIIDGEIDPVLDLQ